MSEPVECQECHNALVCLDWARNGYKAICSNWRYFKKNYVDGNKKIIGDDGDGGSGE